MFKAIFTNFANRASYPIIFHCAQGKDRTGIQKYGKIGSL